MYYLRARYYDPSLGRFISEDTYKGQVDNPLTLNRYTYVHNNPLRFVDPTGHITWEQGWESFGKGVGGFLNPKNYKKAVNDLTTPKNYVPLSRELVGPEEWDTLADGQTTWGDAKAAGGVALGLLTNRIKGLKAVSNDVKILKASNMKEFFNLDFGKSLKNVAFKTNGMYKGQSIYKIDKKIDNPYLKKGDGFYLDSLHYDHMEVFDSKGKVKAVLNLDGTLNMKKHLKKGVQSNGKMRDENAE
ncbi:RHS repeat-associated core domain-containing protein [Brevibacillus nitrificans]|uniref:RHS repeat-associated core domain-containing protein n=1 Tax=Brevibacillus nitrificans TaxID=651560 RepID=UPI002E1C7DEC